MAVDRKPVERLALSPDEVAPLLGVDPSTVRTMCRKGILPTLNTGTKRILIPVGPLHEWAQATRRPIDNLAEDELAS